MWEDDLYQVGDLDRHTWTVAGDFDLFAISKYPSFKFAEMFEFSALSGKHTGFAILGKFASFIPCFRRK
jgi:hypothetical protein